MVNINKKDNNNVNNNVIDNNINVNDNVNINNVNVNNVNDNNINNSYKNIFSISFDKKDIEKQIIKIDNEKLKINNDKKEKKDINKINIFNMFCLYCLYDNNDLFIIDLIKLLKTSISSVFIKRCIDNYNNNKQFEKIGILLNKIKKSDFYNDIKTLLYNDINKSLLIYDKFNNDIVNNLNYKSYEKFKNTVLYYINDCINNNEIYKQVNNNLKTMLLNTISHNFNVIDNEKVFNEKIKTIFNK